MNRTLVTTLIAMLCSLIFLVVNVNYRQKVQFLEGEQGEKAGNFMVALTGYESAIRMYLPFSSRVERAAQQIWKLGEAAERKGNSEQALAAYRSLRSAFYAVRWLRQPGKAWIQRCDTKIAVLAALRKGHTQ
jgi:hypothetical protein